MALPDDRYSPMKDAKEKKKESSRAEEKPSNKELRFLSQKRDAERALATVDEETEEEDEDEERGAAGGSNPSQDVRNRDRDRERRRQ